MLVDNYNNNWQWLFGNPNIKDSFKYAEVLEKLCTKGQSLATRINHLKDIKVDVTEKTLENDEKTFTLKIIGSLNLNNKTFIKEIAEQFASILDKYKKEKIEELSKELDSVINEMKNLFPTDYTARDYQVYAASCSNQMLLNENLSNSDKETYGVGGTRISWTVEK